MQVDYLRNYEYLMDTTFKRAHPVKYTPGTTGIPQPVFMIPCPFNICPVPADEESSPARTLSSTYLAPQVSQSVSFHSCTAMH